MHPATQRIASLDLIRGLALLGILTMNITLALPGPARLVPTIAGGFTGANYAAWILGFLLFDEKMITLFSMLFGAGILLLGQKSKRPGRLFLRRQVILLGIGLVHAYLIWEGDILVPYAICGLVVYPLRRLSPQRLLALGFLIWLPSLALSGFVGRIFAESREANSRVESARASGRKPSAADVELASAWRSFRPSPIEVQGLIEENRRQSWWQLTVRRAPETFEFQTMVFFTSFLWTIPARMLVGMALFKLGILAGTRPPGFYLRAAMAAYLIGFPFVTFAMCGLLARDFDPAYLFSAGLEINQFGSLFVATGHACLLLWLQTSGRFGGQALQAVGRMALTNYLMQSLIATTLFYGYGLAQFGLWDRVHLYGLVFAIWAFQLAVSRVWLRDFQFGPIEWLWRSLTYGIRQPFHKPVSEVA